MSVAAQIVKAEGTIVVAAACSDGFPDHGPYRQLLTSAPDPVILLARIGGRQNVLPGQWQVQIQGRVQRKAAVTVHTSGLTLAELIEAHLLLCDDITATVIDALGRQGDEAALAVLPEGPTTIPYLDIEMGATVDRALAC